MRIRDRSTGITAFHLHVILEVLLEQLETVLNESGLGLHNVLEHWFPNILGLLDVLECVTNMISIFVIAVLSKIANISAVLEYLLDSHTST